VEIVEGARYRRLIRIEGRVGLLAVENASDLRRAHLEVWLCQGLVPVVMPLLARVRQLFDLDAEPAVIEAHLAESGLADAVRGHPGLRVPGSPEGFEAAFRALLRGGRESSSAPRYAGRVVADLGEPFDTGDARLQRCVPTAERVAEAGASHLVRLGVPGSRAQALVAVAKGVCGGSLCLERGGDPAEARRALMSVGVSETVAEDIILRALGWPDAFPLSDRTLQRAVGASSAAALRARAEPWRPWRAYAAQHYRVGAR
jgi:AraC family transcriptional regulator of adaptative response / DNA-3-methyladenine glycosylase II